MTERIAVHNWKCRATWDWVFAQVFQVDTSVQVKEMPEASKTVRRKRRGPPATVTVRWNEVNMSYAADGQSLDGLEDKDEMVVTLAGLGLSQLCPRSELVPWTCTTSEAVLKVLQNQWFHTIVQNDLTTYPVLKAPCGSRGDDIFLAPNTDFIAHVLAEHAQRALDEGPHFLQSLRAKRKDHRQPAFVLQDQILCKEKEARVSIRVYILIAEHLNEPFVYSTAECRAAPNHYSSAVDSKHLRSWFFTNGNGRQDADRILLDLCSDISLVTAVAALLAGLETEFKARQALDEHCSHHSPFAFGALDLMHDQRTGRTLLLEVNRSPAAPPELGLSSAFRAHLIHLALSLIHTVRASTSDSFGSELTAAQHHIQDSFDIQPRGYDDRTTSCRGRTWIPASRLTSCCV